MFARRLFEGYDPKRADSANGDLLLSNQELELFKAYAELDTRARQAVLQFARSLSTATESEGCRKACLLSTEENARGDTRVCPLDGLRSKSRSLMNIARATSCD